MSQNQLVTVDFHGQSLVAVLIDGKPHVALRPIVENIGLDWAAQYTRINRHQVLKSTVVVMAMVAEDGKTRSMVCLPLDMLNGWLFGVDVNRVNDEIKPKLIRYQEECYRVLFQHFMPQQAQRPYNPAIDYDRISPAQAQDLKEIVQAIVKAGVQGYAETWARLQRKFRINSYLELPATQHLEARQYLIAKLPKGQGGADVVGQQEPVAPILDAARIKLAHSLAAEVAAVASRTVFETVLADDGSWRHGRWMFCLTNGRDAECNVPWVQKMDSDAMVVSLAELPRRLLEPGTMLPSNKELADLAAACNRRLAQRMAHEAIAKATGSAS